MLSRLLALLLLSSLAFSQTSTSQPQGQKAPASQAQPAPPQKPALPANPAPAQPPAAAPAPPPKAEEIAPNTPVITINGLCDKPTPGTGTTLAECKTEVTRADFEKILNALGAQVPPQAKQQLGVTYARLLIMEKLARDRNLVNDPRTQELIQLARLQAIAQALQRKLQEEASKSTPQEVEQYYRGHPELWEEVTLQRIYLPRSSGASKDEKPLDEAALKALAEKTRERAAAGEAFDKLQKEAWTAVGIKSEAPSSNTFAVRRANVPPALASVFDLKIGEVSQPLSESGGYYIYKAEARQTIPLDKARPEAEQRLQNEKLQREVEPMMRLIQPTLNEAYFNPGAGSRPPGTPPSLTGAQPPPAAPPKPPQP